MLVSLQPINSSILSEAPRTARGIDSCGTVQSYDTDRPLLGIFLFFFRTDSTDSPD